MDNKRLLSVGTTFLILLVFCSFLGYVFNFFFKDFSLLAGIFFIVLWRFFWKHFEDNLRKIVEKITDILFENEESEEDNESFEVACTIASNILLIFTQYLQTAENGDKGKLMLRDDHSTLDFVSVVTIRENAIEIALFCSEDVKEFSEEVKGHLKNSFGIPRRQVKIKVADELN